MNVTSHDSQLLCMFQETLTHRFPRRWSFGGPSFFKIKDWCPTHVQSGHFSVSF